MIELILIPIGRKHASLERCWNIDTRADYQALLGIRLTIQVLEDRIRMVQYLFSSGICLWIDRSQREHAGEMPSIAKLCLHPAL